MNVIAGTTLPFFQMRKLSPKVLPWLPVMGESAGDLSWPVSAQ